MWLCGVVGETPMWLCEVARARSLAAACRTSLPDRSFAKICGRYGRGWVLTDA